MKIVQFITILTRQNRKKKKKKQTSLCSRNDLVIIQLLHIITDKELWKICPEIDHFSSSIERVFYL